MDISALIEKELETINESDFQKLCFDFINFKYYTFISAPGAVVSKNKTSKGTPDGYFKDKNGGVVFCEVTTRERESKKQFLDKLKGDIEHCFDEKKSEISNKDISEIILFFNSKILPKEDKELQKIVEEYNPNTRLNLFSIQKLGLELKDFPNLSHYLNVDTYMPGIYSLTSFINFKEQFRPDLKNTFFKQEILFNDSLESVKRNDITILYGVQGIGKSKLSIEIAKKLSKSEDYKVIIITDYYENSLKNLNRIINPNEKYLFIIDNYTNDFKNIDRFVKEIYNFLNGNVKFIFTLKNYFLDNLWTDLADYNNKTKINLYDWPKDDIRDFIINSLKEHNLRLNQLAIDRLVDVSKGNVGFCLIGLLPIFENQDVSLIQNPISIFENYFENYKKISPIGDEKNLEILGLLSFFKSIDTKNTPLIKKIQDVWGYDFTDNSETIKYLSKYELLEFDDNNIQMSDDLLSTYVFYKTFINDKIFDLKDLIRFFIKDDFYFINLNNKIVDVINAVGFDIFKEKSFKDLEDVKNEFSNDDEFLYYFYSIFSIFFEEEMIFFSKEMIEKGSDEKFELKKFKIPDIHNYMPRNKYLKLLNDSFKSDNEKTILNLFVDILYEKPHLTKDIFYYISKNYYFSRFEMENGYFYLNSFMDFLENYPMDEKRIIIKNLFLFLIRENNLFGFRHSDQKQESSMSLTLFSFELPCTNELLSLRLRFLKYLFNLYDEFSEEVESILEDYIRLLNKNYIPLIEKEESLIYDFFESLDFNEYKPNKLAFKYKQKLDTFILDNDVESYINSDIIEKIKLYSPTLNNYRDSGRDEKTKLLLDHLESNSKDYYINILEFMRDIKDNEKSCTVYCDELFLALIEYDYDIFINAFNYYMKNDLKLINSFNFMGIVFKKDSPLEIYHLINKYEYLERQSINKWFFYFIPESEINEEIFKYLVDFLNNSDNYFEFLLPEKYLKFNENFLKCKQKYDTTSSNILQFISEILIEKSEKCDIFIDFKYHFCKNFKDYFEDNFELLKQIFFYNLSNNQIHDNADLCSLCKIDKSFLKEYLDWRIDKDRHFYRNEPKLNFIWDLGYENSGLSEIIINLLDKSYLYEELVSLLFSNYNEKEFGFIEYFIENHHSNKKAMKCIFGIIIKYYSEEDFCSFLELFLNKEKDIEVFQYMFDKNDIESIIFRGNFLKYVSICDDIVSLLNEKFNSYDYLEHKKHIKKFKFSLETNN